MKAATAADVNRMATIAQRLLLITPLPPCALSNRPLRAAMLSQAQIISAHAGDSLTHACWRARKQRERGTGVGQEFLQGEGIYYGENCRLVGRRVNRSQRMFNYKCLA